MRKIHQGDSGVRQREELMIFHTKKMPNGLTRNSFVKKKIVGGGEHASPGIALDS